MPYSRLHAREIVRSFEGAWALEHDADTARVLRALRRDAAGDVDWCITWELDANEHEHRVDMPIVDGAPSSWTGSYRNGSVRHEAQHIQGAGLHTVQYYPIGDPRAEEPAFRAREPMRSRESIGAKLSEIVMHDTEQARGAITYWRSDGSELFSATCDNGRRLPGARVLHRSGSIAAMYVAGARAMWQYIDEDGRRMPETAFRAQYPLLHGCTTIATQGEIVAALIGGAEAPRATA